MTGTAKTTRNRPCECEHGCGSKLRASRSQLDRGLYVCPCGGAMVPSALEDMLRAFERGHVTAEQLEAHAEYADYSAALESVQHGQLAHVRKGRTVRSAESLAAERVYKARAFQAYSNQLAALNDCAFGGPVAPASDSMPF